MCTVASAPAAFRVRVWAVMSRGCGPRVGCPPPESVDAAYPPVHKHFFLVHKYAQTKCAKMKEVDTASVFAPALLTVSRGTRLVSEEATPPDPASVRRSTSGYRWASQRIGPGTVGQVPRG